MTETASSAGTTEFMSAFWFFMCQISIGMIETVFKLHQLWIYPRQLPLIRLILLKMVIPHCVVANHWLRCFQLRQKHLIHSQSLPFSFEQLKLILQRVGLSYGPLAIVGLVEQPFRVLDLRQPTD